MCDGAPNLSFWAKVPASTPRLPSPPSSYGPSPYKVVFQTNEGDTPKIVAGLMSGQWLLPERGSSNISWGINPGLAKHFPALIEYYQSTSAPSDSFFAGCSGAGYAYPDQYSPVILPRYFAHVREAVNSAMTKPVVVDVWDYTLNTTLLSAYHMAVPEIDCFTFQSKGAPVNHCLPDGTPVLSSDSTLFYPNLDDKDRLTDLVERIEKVATANPPPFTIIVYGLLTTGADPHPQAAELVLQVARLLPKDKFEVIPITSACQLARIQCATRA